MKFKFYKVVHNFSEETGQYHTVWYLKVKINIDYHPGILPMVENWCVEQLGPRVQLGYSPYLAWHLRESSEEAWMTRKNMNGAVNKQERIQLILELQASKIVGNVIVQELMEDDYREPYSDLTTEELRILLIKTESELESLRKRR